MCVCGVCDLCVCDLCVCGVVCVCVCMCKQCQLAVESGSYVRQLYYTTHMKVLAYPVLEGKENTRDTTAGTHC